MRQNKITLGGKIALTTGLMAALLVLMASYGLYAIGSMNSSLEHATNQTTR